MPKTPKSKLNKIPKKIWRYTLTIVVFLMVVTAYWLWRGEPNIAIATWWNDSWSYRQAIEITNNTNEQTNVYVSLTLNTLTASTSMQSDCGDFRFTTAGGVVLPYYIVSGCRTASNIIHVNFETFPAGAQTIYFYYGNPSAANGFSAPAGSGTVTQANMRLSIVNGTAFADFSSAGTLTNYTGNKVVITDSAGKTLTGYIKAAGTGETYGGEDVSNSDFNNLTGVYNQGPTGQTVLSIETVGCNSGNCLRATIYSADIYGGWQVISNNAQNGSLYKYSCWAKQDTTSGIDMITAYSSGVQTQTTGWMYPSSWTQYTLYQTTNESGQWNKLNWFIHDAAGKSALFDDASTKQVLTPSATGVTITSTANGSTYNWASEESGFNRNDSSNYNYTVYPLAFSVEASNYTVGSVATAEIGPGPIGYWSLDEGYGATAHDETINGNNGTITGATWQSEDMCISGKCLYFDSINDKVTVAATTPAVNTIVFWVKATSTTVNFLKLNDAARVTATNGVVSATGFTSPTIYINGMATTQFSANTWQMVAVTTATVINATSTIIGYAANNYFGGFMDEVKIYPYARTADQIKSDYAAGLAGIKSDHGVSASFGSTSDKWMTDGLVGYWPMDESATTSGMIDYSGNGLTGTYFGNASTTAGKFGRGANFDGSGDKAVVTNATAFDLIDFTYSLWINKRVGSGWRTIMDINSDGQVLAFNGDTLYRWGRCGNGAVTDIASDSGWHHVAWTVIGSNYFIYKDGVQVASGGGCSASIDGSVLNIGHWNDSQWLNATLDEVRVYNRALSVNEVKKLYEWAPGPVAYWKFDEKTGDTAYDTVASTTFFGGNHGTLEGGTAAYRPTWARGKYGSALSFDGVDDSVNQGDYVNAGDLPSLQITGSITVSAWVKAQFFSSSFDNKIVSKYGSFATEKSWTLFATHDNGYTQFAISLSADGTADTTVRYSNTVPVAGTFYYVTGVYNSAAQTMDIYINGMLDNDPNLYGSIPASIYNTATPVTIGDRINGYSRPWNGLIDDVRIYNYARTQKQILEDMKGGSPSTGSGQILVPVLELKFDEGKGAIAYDSTIYQNNGTLNPGTGGSNTASSAMWTLDGKFGKAIEFDGTDDYVNLGQTGPTVRNLAQYTQSAWFKVNTMPTSGTAYDIWYESRNDSGNVRTRLMVENANSNFADVVNSFTWRFRDLDANTPINLNSGANTIAAGNWYHAVAVFDSVADTQKLYLNGILVDSETNAISTVSDTAPYDNIAVGIETATKQQAFNGLIDEVKIYPYALTEEEIKLDYNRGVGAMMGTAGPSTSSGQATSSSAASLDYCVPGSTDFCAPPVGEWKMDEKTGNTAYDTSGNGNDGILYWMATSTNGGWTRGKVGSALSFDGADDYVKLGATALGGDTGTIEATFKADAWPSAGNYRCIVGRYYTDEGICLANDGGTEIIKGEVNGGGGVWHGYNTEVSAGNWYSVAMTYDGSYVRLYINGQESDSADEPDLQTGNWGYETYGWLVGNAGAYLPGSFDDIRESFDGIIDQVRIYNYARTPAQIAYEFNRGKPIAEWRFDECKGGVIYDSAKIWNGGTANNGQLYLGTSGVTATGTCASSSSSTFWGSGSPKLGSGGGSFDGTDDYVNLGNILNFGNGTTDNPFSVSVWVKMDQAEYFRILTKGISGSNVEWYLRGGSDGRMIFYVIDNSTNGAIYSSLGDLNSYEGQWAYLTFTYDGSATAAGMKGYLNGNQNSTEILTGTYVAMEDLNASVYIGRDDNGANYANGLIDDVKIFNYALTAEQVKSEYAGGAVRFGD